MNSENASVPETLTKKKDSPYGTLINGLTQSLNGTLSAVFIVPPAPPELEQKKNRRQANFLEASSKKRDAVALNLLEQFAETLGGFFAYPGISGCSLSVVIDYSDSHVYTTAHPLHRANGQRTGAG